MLLVVFLFTSYLVGPKAYVNTLSSSLAKGGTCGATKTTRTTMHLAADVTSTNAVKGPLSGIDVTSSEYYSSKIKMDSREDVAWLMEPGLLWEAAVQDANDMSPEDYIKDIDRRVSNFAASGEVHDREIFYNVLDSICYPDKKNRGKLRLVLGGKSVGKSLVLGDFKRKLDRKVGYMTLPVESFRVRLFRLEF